MNTTSNKLIIPALALGLVSCLQGPWDYYPDNPIDYRGVFVAGHMVAGRPVTSVCFEALLPLDHTILDAFPFYDSAQVSVSGDFGSGNQELLLSPMPGKPNCFADSSGVLVVPSRNYELEASFWWDSSGTDVQTNLSAIAEVPSRIKVTGSRAPAPAIGGDALLNPQIIDGLVREFGDTITNLISSGDTAAISQFYAENTDKITQIISETQLPYNELDTVFFLPLPFEFLSHYYTMDYSDDVHGILTTTIIDTMGARAENSFDYIFGLKPDSADFPTVGNTFRLLYLPEEELPSGKNLLDTVPIVNSWFAIGQDTLFFYGTDRAYQRYLLTAVQETENTKVRKEYNIIGGQGIFSGMVVDTFVINVAAPEGLITYPYQRTRILSCRNLGWQSDSVCRAALPNFCTDSSYTDAACAPTSVRHSLVAGQPWNHIADSLGLQAGQGQWSKLTNDSIQAQGERLACMDQDFDSQFAYCATWKAECVDGASKTKCMSEVWNFCSDRGYDTQTYSFCGSALVSLRSLGNARSNVLDREIQKWCTTHPQDTQCQRL